MSVLDSIKSRSHWHVINPAGFAIIGYGVGLVATKLAVLDTDPNGFIQINGQHVHHLVFGLGILLVAGIMSVDDVFLRTRAAVFAFGAVVMLDEFSMEVYLKDVYNKDPGDLSAIACIAFLALLLINFLGGRRFLASLARWVGIHSPVWLQAVQPLEAPASGDDVQ